MQPNTGFPIEHLLSRLQGLPPARRWWIGFSGGADSTALLVALCELREHIPATMTAIHFNHQLHPDADRWQSHCWKLCQSLGVELHVETLHLDLGKHQSPETLARQHRYAHMETRLESGAIYLTAHHADDDAETLFLNLMRGSGIEGLAAIPARRKCGNGWVARPFLEFRRAQLRQFLLRRHIQWLEDPSNDDQRLDRNFLRQRVFPMIEQRWPDLVTRLNRSARFAREASEVFARQVGRQHAALPFGAVCWPLAPLLQMERAEQAMLIRHWVRDREARLPPHARLDEFLRQLNSSHGQASACELRWDNLLIKRHHASLWCVQCPFPQVCPAKTWTDTSQLWLGSSFGTLSLSNAARLPPGEWLTDRLRPGCRIQLHPGGPHRRVKELLRVSGIPGWLRGAVPLLYRDGEVMAVGDWQLSPPLRDWLNDRQSDYHWTPRHAVLEQLRALGHSQADAR